MPGMRDHHPWHPEDGPAWRMPRWATLWIPVILAFLIQVPVSLFADRFARGPHQDLTVSTLIALVGPIALIFARRFPGPVVVITAVATVADLFVGNPSGPPYVALAFAVIAAIVRGARVWAWASVGGAWVTAITIAIVIGKDEWSPARVAATTLGILVVIGIGEGLRGRREATREFRRRATQRRESAVQAERVRIARELHDVLAHSLSSINVQAGVGLHLMDRNPEKAKEALASIKESSKSALDEVRAVLGVLRAEGGDDPSAQAAPLVPEPDLDRLPALAAATSTDEFAVDLTDATTHAEIPAPVQLAVFRVVQESLTNIARHAVEVRRATVRLERVGDELRIEVRDDGAGGSRTPAGESGGRGVLGMRERAELLGGRLTAGPAEGGGFRVAAELPLPARRQPEPAVAADPASPHERTPR